jgi:hypothetical protein
MEALAALGYTPHLAGSGPSFFVLVDDVNGPSPLLRRVRDLGFEPRIASTSSRSDALRMELS